MGATKSAAFKKKHNDAATLLKALAHPARVAIVEHLAATQGCICGDMVAVLPLSQATVSQHLRELKQAGLIKGQVEGSAICYCLDGKKMGQLAAWLNQFLPNKAQEAGNCC